MGSQAGLPAAGTPSRIGQGGQHGLSLISSSTRSNSSSITPTALQQSITAKTAQRLPPPSALPRFMQPTSSSKQTASDKLSTPPQSRHLAVPDSASSVSSSSKWKSSSGSSGPVFSTVTRGTRPPAKQPLQPSKPHPTAPRISRPASSCSSTPQHSSASSSQSLSLRSSTSSRKAASTPGSSAASTPVQSSKLGPRRDSTSGCSTTSTAQAGSSASTPPRPWSSKECKSLARVLFRGDDDDDTAGHADQTSTTSTMSPARTSVSFTGTPDKMRTTTRGMTSRIPSAPGTAHAAVSTAPAGKGRAEHAAGAAPGTSSAVCTPSAQEDAALQLLGQHGDCQDSSTTWLSAGCSGEALRQLAGGSCLPAEDELAGSTGSCTAEGRVEAAGGTGRDAPAPVPAAAAAAVPAAAATGSVGELRQEGSTAGSHSDSAGSDSSAVKELIQGPKRSSRAFRGCVVLVFWSLLLLAVGFLAAAVLVDLEGPGPAVGVGSSEALFDDSDIGVLAGVARRYAM